MSNTISTLISAGLDAFVNLYDVEITLPTNLSGISATLVDTSMAVSGNQNKIITRIGNFQPPESSLGEYPIYYQSGSITRQNAKIALNRTFTLPFRIDGNYDLYRVLKGWQGLYLGPSQADYRLPSPEETGYFGNITVSGYNSNVSPGDPITGDLSIKAIWNFDSVICLDVSEPQFGRDAANPVEVSATFLYYFLTPPTYAD
jgi:hypothetical protein